MPINNVVVSRYGTEADFISAFVKSVMNESAFTSNHDLVCKINDVDNINEADTINSVSDADTKINGIYENSKTPYIWFIIDDHTIIMMLYNNRKYTFATFFEGVYSSSIAPDFQAGSDAITTRTYKYQIVSNSNVLFFVVGGRSENFPLVSNNCQTLFVYKNNNDFACGSTVSSALRSTDLQPLTAVNRLEYVNNATDPTAIETIQNKVIITSAGGNKVITMDNIWDSTYSSALMFEVNIGNNPYVYLNNYTVMPI